MTNLTFSAIILNSANYQLQQLVTNDKGENVTKNCPIVAWLECYNKTHIFYFPVSKLDAQTNPRMLVERIVALAGYPTRRLIKSTPTGKTIIPRGYLYKAR